MRRLTTLAALTAAAVALGPRVVEAVQNAAPVGSLVWQGSALFLAAGASILTVAWMTVEQRRRSALLRLVDHERAVHRRVWDAVASGIAVVDAQGRVADWNPAMERLTGTRWHDAVGTILTECAGFDDQRHREALRLALEGVEVALDSGAQDGTQLCGGYYSPIRRPDGERAGAFVIVPPLGTQPNSAIDDPVAPTQSVAA